MAELMGDVDCNLVGHAFFFVPSCKAWAYVLGVFQHVAIRNTRDLIEGTGSLITRRRQLRCARIYIVD